MSLLDNAGNSIRLGLEDLESGKDDRLLSASRNFYAGILLLYKEKLRRLSPPASNEVLLKTQIRPSIDSTGALTFVGSGKKTVDVQQIKDRFKDLSILVDWTRLDKITAIRNEIEHYYSSANRDAVRGIISAGFLLFRDFCRKQLAEDPMVLVGTEAWSAMTEVAEVFEREREHCLEQLGKFEWTCSALAEAIPDASCTECGSLLIEPRGDTRRPEIQCLSCGEVVDFEKFAEHAMQVHYDDIGLIQEGGDPEVISCPNCSADAYHYPTGICAVCEESVEQECSFCSSPIPPSELDDDGICGYCRQVIFKDD